MGKNRGYAKSAINLAAMIPYINTVAAPMATAIDTYDAGRSLHKGDYTGAAINATQALIGAGASAGVLLPRNLRSYLPAVVPSATTMARTRNFTNTGVWNANVTPSLIDHMSRLRYYPGNLLRTAPLMPVDNISGGLETYQILKK